MRLVQLWRFAKLRTSTPRPAQNASQLRAQVLTTSSTFTSAQRCTGGAHEWH